jgi:hypothetical protein
MAGVREEPIGRAVITTLDSPGQRRDRKSPSIAPRRGRSGWRSRQVAVAGRARGTCARSIALRISRAGFARLRSGKSRRLKDVNRALGRSGPDRGHVVTATCSSHWRKHSADKEHAQCPDHSMIQSLRAQGTHRRLQPPGGRNRRICCRIIIGVSNTYNTSFNFVGSTVVAKKPAVPLVGGRFGR